MAPKKRRHHPPSQRPEPVDEAPVAPAKLEIVLKSDTVGTLAAVRVGLEGIDAEGAQVDVLHEGVGAVTQSDVTMAVTGSRLVLGFCVDVLQRVEETAKGHSVEVRLYEVIYHLTRDVAEIAGSLVASVPEERVTGKARVIALFKSTRKGIILGCEVSEGSLALGKRFRVIGAMGPVYEGTVESLHIEADAVKAANKGQQVGLKVAHFKDAKVGDVVECYETAPKAVHTPWRPHGGVRRERG